LATRGQGDEDTSGSDTEEIIPKPRRKRKKVSKQPAALAAARELHENREGDNKEAIKDSSSDIMTNQSDTDDKNNETDSTVTE
jgi:hypothetical protein